MEFKEISREEIYQGSVFDVQRVHIRLPNQLEKDYDLVVHAKAVVLVPIDQDGNLLFVQQFRLGAGQVLLELPAGILDKGETPEKCAKREIREETGMAAQHLQKIGEMYITPGYCTEYQYIFLAQGLKHNPLSSDADEFIHVQQIPVEEAYEMVGRGEINDAKTIAALLLAQPFIQSRNL
jgi:ADP-ribose pyrophosphatase